MDTRSRIQREAKKLFSAKGYDGLRMDELAKQCGKNKATLYYHFESKTELYNLIVRESLENSVERMKHAVKAARMPSEQLKAFIDTMIAINPQDICLIHLAMISGGEYMQPETLSGLFNMKILLNSILDAGIEAGEFRDTHSFVLMQLIMGTLNSYILNTTFRNRVLDTVRGNPGLQKALNISIDDKKFADELYVLIMNAIGTTHG